MPGLVQLEERLGHSFTNRDVLDAALTHGSSQKSDDYQRLEFLGDRVLSLVIADELYTRFPAEKEGQLAARLSLLVRAEACAAVAGVLQLAPHIKVGAVEKRKGVNAMASVLADAMEAVIGALYLDGGYEKARALILRCWNTMLSQAPADLKDAKTFVQEWALGRGLPLPSYRELGREGPQHAPRFTIALSVGTLAAAVGQGGSKQVAEMEAAKAFIQREGLR